MSSTIRVPAAVPSVTQNSAPAAAVSAPLKKMPPFQETIHAGLELPPGRRSPTSCVPATVPSVRHSSVPLIRSVAWKNKRPPCVTW